jgi:hypothetical protein
VRARPSDGRISDKRHRRRGSSLGLCGGEFLLDVLDVHSVKAQEVLAKDLALGLLGELRVDVAVAEFLGDLQNALSAHWVVGCEK